MVKFWVILSISYSWGNITSTWWQKWNRCSFNTPESREPRLEIAVGAAATANPKEICAELNKAFRIDT